MTRVGVGCLLLPQKALLIVRTEIPAEKYKIQKPVFYGGAARDLVCVAAVNEAQTRQFCPNVTVAHFDTTHWVGAEAPKEVNEALEKWIQEAVLA